MILKTEEIRQIVEECDRYLKIGKQAQPCGQDI